MMTSWQRIPRALWSGLVRGLPLAAGWDADEDDDEPTSGLVDPDDEFELDELDADPLPEDLHDEVAGVIEDAS